MNRNTIYRLLLFLAVPLYSISCNDDFLERYPEGEVTEAVPASVLQLHPDCILIADQEAASKL